MAISLPVSAAPFSDVFRRRTFTIDRKSLSEQRRALRTGQKADGGGGISLAHCWRRRKSLSRAFQENLPHPNPLIMHALARASREKKTEASLDWTHNILKISTRSYPPEETAWVGWRVTSLSN